MSQWKYTDNTNQVVFRVNEDGSMESCLASVLPEGTEILPADPVDPIPARITAINARIREIDTIYGPRYLRELTLANPPAGMHPKAITNLQAAENEAAELRAELEGM